MGCGVDKRSLKTFVYQVLLGLASARRERARSRRRSCRTAPVICMCCRPIASSPAPRSNWCDVEARETRLKRALAEVAADYDFVLIDCPAPRSRCSR
jgi:chromosome partitioning protein